MRCCVCVCVAVDVPGDGPRAAGSKQQQARLVQSPRDQQRPEGGGAVCGER